MALALAPFMDTKLNSDFTPTSNYAANEAKNSALIDQAAQVKQASQRLSGRMNDVTQAIKSHDIMNQGVQDLMIANPELYKQMSEAVKSQEDLAVKRAEKTANFMAGVVPYITGAKLRGIPEAQAYNDYIGFAKMNGIPLGQFENMPYSEETLQMLKSSVYGIKGVLESGSTVSKEDGALVTRTPLGDVKDVKVLPQEKTDKPVPLRTYKKGNKEITEEFVDGAWRLKATADAYKPDTEFNKPPAGYRWNASGTLEAIPGGPADKTATPSVYQASEDERKAAGWVVQAGNALNNLRQVIQDNPESMKQPLLEVIAPERFVNAFRSSDRQRFVQAASSFSEAALRAATGAGVNESEARQKIAELTPVYGDQDPVIAQKLKSLGLYLKSLEARAGRALPNAQQALASEQPTMPAPIKPVASAQPKPAAQQFRQIKSAADYNALPSGAIFIDPNGVKRRKP